MKLRFGILKHTEELILIALWLAVLAVPLFMFPDSNAWDWDQVFESWRNIWPFFLLFLINHFILIPFLLFKKRKFTYFISAIILAVVFSFSLHLLERQRIDRQKFETGEGLHYRPPPPHEMGVPPEKSPNPPGGMGKRPPFIPFINTLILGILVIGFDTGFRLIVKWSKLERERTLLEKENVQNQLAFLRNQVSPHFFMNTLNNIHALIDVDKEEAKESIIKLSKLMRHLLYDSDTEFVPLKKELEFITSYINLMKLRFSDKVNIYLQLPENIPNKIIPPYLFTSFVENAFKHGISYQNSSYINIKFSLDPEHLIFEIKNSMPELKKENKASGIGVENSKKRLDILYGNKYSLNIEETNEDYKLTLIVPV